MPTTAAGWTLTEAHRLAQIRLAAGVGDDVSKAWGLLDFGRLDASFPRYADAILPRVQARRAASSRLGLRFYSALRSTEGVTGAFDLVGAEPGTAKILTSLAVTGPVTVKRALARGVNASDALALGLSQTARAMTRHTLDGGRSAILDTSRLDDKSHGYQRVSDGRPCHFCAMLVSRGAVYWRKETADFIAHDGCGCSAVPFWERTPTQTAQAEEFRRLYDATARGQADPANAFRRAYMAQDRQSLSITKRPPSSPAKADALAAAGTAWEESTDFVSTHARTNAARLSDAEHATETLKAEADAAEWARELAAREERLAAERVSLADAKRRVKERRKDVADNADHYGLSDAEKRRSLRTDDYLNNLRSSVKYQEGYVQDGIRNVDAAVQMLARARETERLVREHRLTLAQAREIHRLSEDYRLFTKGPHSVYVKKDAAVSIDGRALLFRDFDLARESLPEWRRVTWDGRERAYEIFVDDHADGIGASAYTYCGANQVWVSPQTIRDAETRTSGFSPWTSARHSMPARDSHGWLRYVLTHEFGHTTDVPGYRFIAKTVDDPRSTDLYARVLGDPDLEAHTSAYGRTEPSEMYAEVFAEWALGDGTNPVAALYDEVFGWSESRAAYTGHWKEVGGDHA